MSEVARLYRYAITFEPLYAPHELVPEVAEEELLALGGTRSLAVCAASQDQVSDLVDAVMRDLLPGAQYQQVSIECAPWPMSGHEEIALRQKHPELVAGRALWPGGAPL